jgi:hypothetical protein
MLSVEVGQSNLQLSPWVELQGDRSFADNFEMF